MNTTNLLGIILFLELSFISYMFNADIAFSFGLGFALVTLAFEILPKQSVDNFTLASQVAIKTSQLERGSQQVNIAQINDVHKATREVLRTLSNNELRQWINIGR